MKNFIILLTTGILLVGCGNSSSSSTSTPSRNINMELAKPYTLFEGDKIIRDSEDSQLQIEHKDYTKQSTVTLLAGSATIIRVK